MNIYACLELHRAKNLHRAIGSKQHTIVLLVQPHTWCVTQLNVVVSEGLWPAAGGENGFNQAIELSADTLANVKFVQEKRLISKFFDEISQDTSKFVFGVADTLQCLEMGAVETLVVWEDLQVYRYTLMNSTSGNHSLYT